MPQNILYSVIFISLLCRARADDEDQREKFRNLFKEDITRNDFGNLLQSLIRLNEQRVNVLQKLYRLEDYGVLSEVLRSGKDLDETNKSLNDLILVLLEKNKLNSMRRNMGPIPQLNFKSENDSKIPELRTKVRQEKNQNLEPAVSSKNTDLSDESLKLLIGNAIQERLAEAKKKRANDMINRGKHMRHISSNSRSKEIKLVKAAKGHMNRVKGTRSKMGRTKVARDETNNGIEYSKPVQYGRNLKKPNEPRSMVKDNSKIYPFLVENDSNTKYPKKTGSNANDAEIYTKPPTDNLNAQYPQQIAAKTNDDNRKEPLYSSIEMYTELREDNIQPTMEGSENQQFNRIPVRNEAIQNPNLSEKRQDRFQIADGRTISHPTKVNDRIEGNNPNTMKLQDMNDEQNYIALVPGRSGTRDENTTNTTIVKNIINIDDKSKVNQERFIVDSEKNKQLNAGQEEINGNNNLKISKDVVYKKDTDNTVLHIELNSESENGAKLGRQRSDEDGDETEYAQSSFETADAGIESRKNLQKCINKKALKMCTKSCKTSYKNVCRRLKCTSKAKKTIKKECKKSCKNTFRYSSKKRDTSDDASYSYD